MRSFYNRFFHSASSSFGITVFAVSLLAGAVLYTGCLPKKDQPPQQQPTETATQQVIAYVNNTLTACATTVSLLDVEADAHGRNNPDSARAIWRRARAQYEQARFAMEEFAPVYHQRIAAWFTPAPPSQGFHYIESLLFGADSANPNWSTIEASSLAAFGFTQQSANSISIANINDSGIFSGLEYMLADIDSIKFSGWDSSYSKNSYSDIFSNYNGLDSVYKYYQPIVKDSSVAADSVFTARLNSARLALVNAGSLAALDKNAYNVNYLYPLDTALKQAAKAIGIRLP